MGGRREIRLTDFEMDNMSSLSFQSLGTFQYFHYIERRDIFRFF